MKQAHEDGHERVQKKANLFAFGTSSKSLVAGVLNSIPF